jgi:hypothetical protein
MAKQACSVYGLGGIDGIEDKERGQKGKGNAQEGLIRVS